MQIKDTIIQIIAMQLNIKESQCIYTTHLIKDLGVDSLDKLEIVANIENTLHIHLSDSDVGNIHTIGDVVSRAEEIYNMGV